TEAITTRRATQDDTAALLPLVQAYRVFYEQQTDAQREREYIERHLRERTSVIYIAESGTRAARFTQLFKTYSTVHLGGSWILEDLFVHPDYRHRGAGSALLAHALRHAREDAACGMFLKTAHDNGAAQALYEKAGWTREGHFIKYNAPLAD
ncbi:MAG TPA: GNAT family N-acetyltransferase, partial [Candidatus Baltobacteraceae bacterium]